MSAPRRMSTGRPGIYQRATKKGETKYEIVYYDDRGNRCWKVVNGGIRDAIALREELRTKARKGESPPKPSRERFEEVAGEWLERTAIRPRTREWYESALRLHVNPRLGYLRISEVTVKHIESLIEDMRGFERPGGKRGYAGWTIRGVLTVVSRVLAFAVEEGKLAADPMDVFRKRERGRGAARKLPKVGRRQRVLTDSEIVGLLDKAGELYRPLLATAVFAGLRLGELLALRWADVEFAGETIHVGAQLQRRGKDRPVEIVEPKTQGSERDVDMSPVLARILREHKARSAFSKPKDFVFAGQVGTPLAPRNVERRGLDKAAEAAGINDGNRPKLRVHDLRHTYASMMIHEGASPVYVSRQLGHASPEITLRVYADEFARAEHSAKAKAALESRFGATVRATTVLPKGGGKRRKRQAVTDGQVVDLQAVSRGGD